MSTFNLKARLQGSVCIDAKKWPMEQFQEQKPKRKAYKCEKLAKPNSTPVLMFHIILFQCDFLHKHKQPAVSVNPHRVEIILSTYTTCIIYTNTAV